jgi:triacylglycerol esterase/lipase EstA (alpha/beta hydrolase family)
MFVAFSAVVVVVAVLVTALVVAHRGQGVGGVDQSRPGPVLLVPGYGGSVTSLESLAASLRTTGRDVTIVDLPDHALGDLTDQATSLAAAARVALDRTRAGSVDVVGYSAGGVVARLWVTEDGGATSVRRLVTLGSPHHGTDLAELGALLQGTCPVACQQLSPSSPLLARLEAEPLPAGPEYLSLWTARDDVVVPPSSAVIDGVPSPSLQSICPASQVRHSGLPSDPLVQRLVAEALARGPVPTWGPADCTRLTS